MGNFILKENAIPNKEVTKDDKLWIIG